MATKSLNALRGIHTLTPGVKKQSKSSQEIEKESPPEDVEEIFKSALKENLSRAAEIGDADIVVGIPFYNETDTIRSVLRIIGRGLRTYYPEQKCVIVAVGSPSGKKALQIINATWQSVKIRQISFLLDDERISGKGWAIRAIMEIARALGADLAVFEADLRSRSRDSTIEGLAPDWVKHLFEPIRKGEIDMVISRFNHHYFESLFSAHLIYPLFTAIYNRPVHDPLRSQWAVSNRLLRVFIQDMRDRWDSMISSYGIDSWLVTTAVTNGAEICEANLGVRIVRPSSIVKEELVLRLNMGVLFKQIVADRKWWSRYEDKTDLQLLKPLPVCGAQKSHLPDSVIINPQRFIERYKQGFNKFYPLYSTALPEEVYKHLEELAGGKIKKFDFPDRLWAKTVYGILLDFAFRREFAESDLLYALIPLYQGYVASYALKMQELKNMLASLPATEVERLLIMEAEGKIESLFNEFWNLKPEFLSAWRAREEALKPPVPTVTYIEFIPGVPLVVPLELARSDGTIVTANTIRNSIFQKYTEEFNQFVYNKLGLPDTASYQEVARRIGEFMQRLEHEIDLSMLPGDLFTIEGTRQVVEAIFNQIPRQTTFALLSETSSWLLHSYPPLNIVTKLGYSSLDALLNDYEPNDVLALARWSEEQDYVDRIWGLIKENVRTEHFGPCQLKPLILNYEDFPSLLEMKESALNMLTGRVVVSNLHKGMGGMFPKLRYFTTIVKNIVEGERFGDVWRRFAEQRKDFGERILNSLEGHWGREPLSAHNIFENENQRALISRVREMTGRIHEEGNESKANLVTCLNHMIDSYHLVVTLPDGTFVPCSAWTWASYSFKGGTGIPTPFSVNIERDWASNDFLKEYYKAIGGKEETIRRVIVRLMEQGREWENLTSILLGDIREALGVIPKTTVSPERPPAGVLHRFDGNPVLLPVREHKWESKYVFNPGAINLDGKVYLVYRAVGEDGISRLGLASSGDGFHFNERLEEPIFEPGGKSEEKGCEDPRLTVIGNRIYMLYTAYSGLVAQIAMASINIKDFQDYNWKKWQRHGLVFPRFPDKDGAIFSEQFNGKYIMLHRVEPHIWITLSPHLSCPWPRKEHKILAGSPPGMVWDGRKVGAGAQPLKTSFGWLLISHGVDHAHVYRLGVMLLDLEDPTNVIYRSPNPILEPFEKYEKGEPNKSWVPNVVFTCGAVPRESDKDVLGADDEILVYYGAADTVIGVATTKISELIPEQFRSKSIKLNNQAVLSLNMPR